MTVILSKILPSAVIEGITNRIPNSNIFSIAVSVEDRLENAQQCNNGTTSGYWLCL